MASPTHPQTPDATTTATATPDVPATPDKPKASAANPAAAGKPAAKAKAAPKAKASAAKAGKPAVAKPKPAAKRQAPQAAPTPAPDAFALPAGTTPAALLTEYLHAKATADADAAARALPSITHAGKAIIHASWLHAWLIAKFGPAVPKRIATDTLRAAGFKARSLPFSGLANGQTRMAVFVGDAPRGTSDIARQAAPARGTRAPAAPPSEAAAKALDKAAKAARSALAPLPADEHAWAMRRLPSMLRAEKVS